MESNKKIERIGFDTGGEAPSALKQSVGAQIIASSNLTDEEKNQVLADFNSQIVQPPVTQVA